MSDPHDHHAHGSHDPHQNSSYHEDFNLPSHDFGESDPLIEPAGFMNDLSFGGMTQTIDLTIFFPIREVFPIDHHKTLVIQDIVPGGLKEIDLSRRLVLSLLGKPTPELADLYHESLFRPKLLETFTRSARLPRFRYI